MTAGGFASLLFTQRSICIALPSLAPGAAALETDCVSLTSGGGASTLFHSGGILRRAAFAGARWQRLRNRLRLPDFGRSQSALFHSARHPASRFLRWRQARQLLRNRLRIPDFGRSRQHCSTQRGILRRAFLRWRQAAVASEPLAPP